MNVNAFKTKLSSKARLRLEEKINRIIDKSAIKKFKIEEQIEQFKLKIELFVASAYEFSEIQTFKKFELGKTVTRIEIDILHPLNIATQTLNITFSKPQYVLRDHIKRENYFTNNLKDHLIDQQALKEINDLICKCRTAIAEEKESMHTAIYAADYYEDLHEISPIFVEIADVMINKNPAYASLTTDELIILQDNSQTYLEVAKG